MNRDFNNMAQYEPELYTHLKAALAIHGVTFVSRQFAMAIAEIAQKYNLSGNEKAQVSKSVCDEFALLLRVSME